MHLVQELKLPILVFLGGGLGAVARWGIARWASQFPAAQAFPWHTFAINVLGSFILGILTGLCHNRPGWLAFLGVGVCGGFTTFSTFSVETIRLIDDHRATLAALYVAGSVIAACLGAWLGLKFAK